MSSQIAFNKIVIGSTTIASDEFVTGTGSFAIRGNDKSVATADGIIHHHRICNTPEASCRIYGDKRSLSSPMGEASAVSLYYNSTLLKTFNGIVSVSLASDPDISSITISGDPEL